MIDEMPHHPFLRHFNKSMRLVAGNGKSLPTLAQLDLFEKQHGLTLPNQYLDFLLKYGGVFLEAKEEVWPTPSTGEVRPFWATNYGFKIFGIGDEIPNWLDLKGAMEKLAQRSIAVSEFLPFHKEVAGDGSFTGFTQEGRIITLETNGQYSNKITLNFDEFVEAEAIALSERIDLMLHWRETGQWLTHV